jgi:hypothetical protein
MYTDPTGEFWHIIIGAAIGGVVNLGIKAYQGKIHSFGDGLVAFGIGAVAGAVGAATGGAAFGAAGGGAAGAGGFFAGTTGGMVGSAASIPIQSAGNTMYFGDPMPTGKQYVMGIVIGGLVSGTTQGLSAVFNGRSFWNGSISETSSIPGPNPTMNIDDPEVSINTDGMRSELQSVNDIPRQTLKQQSFIIVKTGDGQYKWVNISETGTEAAESEGKTIGLGLDDDLTSLRGTITYKNAGWQQAGLTKVDWGKASCDNYYFKQSFMEAAQNADAIKFNLSSFNSAYPKPGITNFEFDYITSNPLLLQKTTFILNSTGH